MPNSHCLNRCSSSSPTSSSVSAGGAMSSDTVVTASVRYRYHGTPAAASSSCFQQSCLNACAAHGGSWSNVGSTCTVSTVGACADLLRMCGFSCNYVCLVDRQSTYCLLTEQSSIFGCCILHSNKVYVVHVAASVMLYMAAKFALLGIQL